MVPLRYAHTYNNPGPFNPQLAGNIVPAVQCYVAHGGTIKTQSNSFLVKPTEKAAEVPPVSRQTVEDNLPLLTVRSDRMLVIRGSFRMFPESLSEEFKTVQSLPLNFLRKRPLVRQSTSTSDCRGVGNVLEAIL